MSSSQIMQDNSLLSRCDQWLYRWERRLNLLAGMLVLLIVLFSVINILGRGLLNKPFNAYFDLMGQSVPLIAFLGISYCQRIGGHIRMDLLIIRLRGRWLWALEFLSTLLTMLVIGLLAWGAFLHAERSWSFGDSTEDIGLTVWPFKAMIALMLAVLAARLLLQAWGYLRLIITNDNRPIAVPVPIDVAAQAKQAAEELPEDTDNRAPENNVTNHIGDQS